MKVGIIGTGNVGSALTAGVTAAGHDVVVGSRDPPRTGICQFAVRSSNGVRMEREHLDRLAERYTDQAKYPGPGGQQRVVLVIRPDNVSGQSPPSRNR